MPIGWLHWLHNNQSTTIWPEVCWKGGCLKPSGGCCVWYLKFYWVIKSLNILCVPSLLCIPLERALSYTFYSAFKTGMLIWRTCYLCRWLIHMILCYLQKQQKSELQQMVSFSSPLEPYLICTWSLIFQLCRSYDYQGLNANLVTRYFAMVKFVCLILYIWLC